MYEHCSAVYLPEGAEELEQDAVLAAAAEVVLRVAFLLDAAGGCARLLTERAALGEKHKHDVKHTQTKVDSFNDP